jgi:hypothetical protein
MPGSFLDETNGPIINKTYMAEVVSGSRKDVPPGWTGRRKEVTRTEYGVRIDIVYSYPDGKEVRR